MNEWTCRVIVIFCLQEVNDIATIISKTGKPLCLPKPSWCCFTAAAEMKSQSVFDTSLLFFICLSSYFLLTAPTGRNSERPGVLVCCFLPWEPQTSLGEERLCWALSLEPHRGAKTWAPSWDSRQGTKQRTEGSTKGLALHGFSVPPLIAQAHRLRWVVPSGPIHINHSSRRKCSIVMPTGQSGGALSSQVTLVCVRMTKVDQHSGLRWRGDVLNLEGQERETNILIASMWKWKESDVYKVISILLGGSYICYSISWYVGFMHVYDACVHQHSGVWACACHMCVLGSWKGVGVMVVFLKWKAQVCYLDNPRNSAIINHFPDLLSVSVLKYHAV